jgi:hypothetical protein
VVFLFLFSFLLLFLLLLSGDFYSRRRGGSDGGLSVHTRSMLVFISEHPEWIFYPKLLCFVITCVQISLCMRRPPPTLRSVCACWFAPTAYGSRWLLTSCCYY